MKRYGTILLMLGYVVLVPFCFLSAMTSSTHGQHAHPSTHCVHDVADVGILDTLLHHSGMYLTMTGTTPMSTPALSLVALLYVIAFIAALFLRSVPLERATQVYTRRGNSRRLRHLSTRNFLSWLSLTETSPTTIRMA